MKNTPRIWLGFATALSVLLLIGYGLVYQLEPFPSFWNDFWLNVFTISASLFTVAAALMVMSAYHQQDAVHRVWLFFSIGFSLWTLAEIIWAYYNLTVGDVPIPSLSDYLWIAGYIFFGLGFVWQYRVLFTITLQRGLVFLAGSSLITLAATWFLQFQFGDLSSSNFVNLLYPIADLVVSIVAFRLVWSFRGGAMARPWLTLLVFSLADGAYAWLVQTGAYAWSGENGNILSLIADTMYTAAYLILAVGFLYQFFLLRYGPWAFGKRK